MPIHPIRRCLQGKLIAILVGAALIASGCAHKAAFLVDERAGKTVAYSMSTQAYAATTQRFIAVRHKLEVIATESELQRAWQATIDFCATIQCEVVSSSITAKTRYLSPSGTIFLRVSPDDVKKLFSFLEKQGTIAQHSTETEDKTSDVIDAEAKIKNLTTFRDNLRAMLAKPSATVKDSVEIQQQLTDVQSKLDSELVQRKVLANETEKASVDITFRLELSGGEPRGWAQIWSALRESGAVLSDSIYWLIIVIVTVLPWLVVVLPVVWFLAKLWRKRRSARAPSQSQV